MGSADDVHRIIADIYDAALDPSLWEPVLKHLSDVMAGALITFHIQDAAGCIRSWHGVRHDPERTELFLNGPGYTEPKVKAMAAALAAPPATFVPRETIQSDADFRRSAIYNDIFRPQGLWHWGFSAVARERDHIAIFGIARRNDSNAYDRRELNILNCLLPHFQRAAQVSLRLQAVEKGPEAIAIELLETLSVGVAMVAANGRLLYANRIAEKAIRAGDGLRVSQGRLRPQFASDAQVFERAVFDTVPTASGTGLNPGRIMHLRRSDRGTLPVLIAPFRAAGSGRGLSSVAVIFADPYAATTIPRRILMSRWNLTPAEARLAAALAEGQELADYAYKTSIGIGTARTHLKQVFAKTGFRRQAELVGAVLSDPLMRLHPLVMDEEASQNNLKRAVDV